MRVNFSTACDSASAMRLIATKGKGMDEANDVLLVCFFSLLGSRNYPRFVGGGFRRVNGRSRSNSNGVWKVKSEYGIEVSSENSQAGRRMVHIRGGMQDIVAIDVEDFWKVFRGSGTGYSCRSTSHGYDCDFVAGAFGAFVTVEEPYEAIAVTWWFMLNLGG